MGFLKSIMAGDPTREASHSRSWIAANGEMSRKNAVAFALVNRLARHPLGGREACGHPLEGADLESACTVVRDALSQEPSLAACVARDVALLFETFGGLSANHDTVRSTMGLTVADADASLPEDVLAIARTIHARSNEREGSESDVRRYVSLYEDRDGYERAVRISAWAGVAVARMLASGALDPDIPVFSASFMSLAAMEQPGWYPNPINAGVISAGEPQIEREWNGTDWTDRVRVRQGRGWREDVSSMFKAPTN